MIQILFFGHISLSNHGSFILRPFDKLRACFVQDERFSVNRTEVKVINDNYTMIMKGGA
jgi:hypothetical protein